MPRQYTPRLECVCARCGISFTLPPSYALREGVRYCSQACYHAGPRPGKKHHERVCEQCGGTFTAPNSRAPRFCSLACNRAGLKGGTYHRDCAQCGQRFQLTHLKSPRQFCSRVCRGKARRTLVPLTCPMCERPFLRKPSQIARHATQYCCVPCKNLGIAKDSAIDDRKARNTGIYKAWRLAVLHRDKRTCQECGHVGGRLHAHHIKPFVSHHALRHVVSNGITFCQACHEALHTNSPRGHEVLLS